MFLISLPRCLPFQKKAGRGRCRDTHSDFLLGSPFSLFFWYMPRLFGRIYRHENYKGIEKTFNSITPAVAPRNYGAKYFTRVGGGDRGWQGRLKVQCKRLIFERFPKRSDNWWHLGLDWTKMEVGRKNKLDIFSLKFWNFILQWGIFWHYRWNKLSLKFKNLVITGLTGLTYPALLNIRLSHSTKTDNKEISLALLWRFNLQNVEHSPPLACLRFSSHKVDMKL